MKTMNPSGMYRMFGVSLSVGVDPLGLFGENGDCEGPGLPRFFREAKVESFH